MMLSEPKFTCPDPTCNRRAFKRLNHLNAHLTTVHGSRPVYRGNESRPYRKEPVTCYTCNITFANSLDYRKHIRTEH